MYRNDNTSLEDGGGDRERGEEKKTQFMRLFHCSIFFFSFFCSCAVCMRVCTPHMSMCAMFVLVHTFRTQVQWLCKLNYTRTHIIYKKLTFTWPLHTILSWSISIFRFQAYYPSRSDCFCFSFCSVFFLYIVLIHLIASHI